MRIRKNIHGEFYIDWSPMVLTQKDIDKINSNEITNPNHERVLRKCQEAARKELNERI